MRAYRLEPCTTVVASLSGGEMGDWVSEMNGVSGAPVTWDRVLMQPSRWGTLAVAVSVGVGVLAALILVWPVVTPGPWPPAWLIVALSVPQLFYRVHGAAVLTAVALLATQLAMDGFWGGREWHSIQAIGLLGAATVIELVNLFGKKARWGMRRGLQGALLGMLVLMAVAYFGFDIGTRFSPDSNPALVGALWAALVFVPLVLAGTGAIYVVLRIIISFAMAAFENRRRGSASPGPQ